ncbi:MAG: tetratricopeptide repeat protein [Bacillota bacterium]
MRGLSQFSCLGALLACGCGLAAVVAAPASAQGSYSPYNESPAAALARYVRALADDPKDFSALIGAGRAALELGDTQAAAGFFARADEVNPRSPAPQEGMGAVSVANGDAKAAMPYFKRAQQLGATQAMLGCERGLAYDMLGEQAKAQADYRAALSGPDSDEARRRLALSLAISGNKADALAAIAPLAAKGDATTPRVRAFILALTGDSNAAMAAIDAAMPGSWSRVAPFLQRLPALAAGQKAAAVNLGIFPDSNGTAYAYAAPVRTAPSTATQTVSTDRLAGIDALLTSQSAQAQPVWQQPSLQDQPQPRAIQVAYSAPSPRPATVQRTDAAASSKIWLQLASGRNADALSDQFARMQRDNPELFKGITGYVAEGSDRARLVVGPFRGTTDAKIFADDLRSVGIDAFRWSNSDSERIVPLATE